MSDLNYHHLRYFWAVAHDGNLTRTAERMNLSQSALSAQIKQLEGRLGQALFERRGRALHLTEAGRIALDHADTIFATGEELLDTLRESARPARALRVGALSTLSRNFQLSFLKPVLGRPDVEVILRSGSAPELYAALDSLNLDVLLTNTPPAQDALTSYVTQKLADQTVGLFGTKDRVSGNQPLEQLIAEHPLILPTRETQIRAGFDALLRRVRATPRIAAEIDDMAMIRLLARQGTGLAVVPPIVVQDELKRGELKQAAMLDLHELFYAVTLNRRYPNPLLAELLDVSNT
ncbi:LysR family transcriptional regulator [Marivita hallyeonensis]|uniref:Transcriptional regulator, LysR family n=1 Tax=Marivita hallyeonensis TaxID=996342 RepID=A0A1M5SGF4_9RHOB|nr:LysR family transcriptional regulator [Marivita hallyeonensis]SHH37624.1 transcriptional regulator, LysR family [Marivita hallyeonensis]